MAPDPYHTAIDMPAPLRVFPMFQVIDLIEENADAQYCGKRLSGNPELRGLDGRKTARPKMDRNTLAARRTGAEIRLFAVFGFIF